MMIKNTLYLVRHGQTLWNAEGRFQGRSEVPLSREGRRQALGNAQNLRVHLERLGQSPPAIEIVSSPLSRCMETMGIMASELGIEEGQCRIDPRLIEAGFGRWEGLTTHEVKARFPEERRRRKTDRWHFAPEGGTSHAAMARDMSSLLQSLPENRPVLLVSHSGNLRVMFAMLQGIGKDEAMRIAVPHDRMFGWSDGRLAII